LELIVIIGAPLQDYTFQVDDTRTTLKSRMVRSQLTMVAIAIGLAILFVALSVPATYLLIGWPMVRLTKHIVAATKFDFTALHGVDRHQRSFIKELAIIEASYWTMVCVEFSPSTIFMPVVSGD
jgi:hypothetical protein